MEDLMIKEFLTPSQEIRIYQNEKGYWLFTNQKIKESRWVKENKLLKEGVNEFEGDFPNGYYLMRVKIDSKNLAVSFYGKGSRIINAETFKLFKHKSFEVSERGAIITPQVFAYLEDFGLLKMKGV